MQTTLVVGVAEVELTVGGRGVGGGLSNLICVATLLCSLWCLSMCHMVIIACVLVSLEIYQMAKEMTKTATLTVVNA